MNEKMKKFHIFTLGCKINQYESQALREAWLKAGLLEAESPAQAQVVLVNTCAVTARAVADARQSVRRLAREAEGADIVVTGCAARLDGECFEKIPGVRRVVLQTQKASLCQGPLALAPQEKGYLPFEISDYPRGRAVLKVQDGCSQICSYCIVPLSRGPSRSRPEEAVLAEALRLIGSGFRELVISGVNLSQWGRDLGQGRDFWDLLLWLQERLAPDYLGKVRLRLSSLDPWMLSEKAGQSLARLEMLCPHLHLSLQSGDAGVLRDMGRGHYSPEIIPKFLDNLSAIWPLFGLGADILTGFPSEDAQAFATTLKFVEALPLGYAHVFPYSRRPGTAAFDMKSLASSAEKRERAAQLRGLAARKKEEFIRKVAALPELSVVVEQSLPAKGVCEYFVPCRFKTSQTQNYPLAPRSLVRAAPLAAEADGLSVAPLAEPGQ